MKSLWQSLRMLAALSLLTGLVYPLLMTGAAQLLYRDKANGSLISVDGKRIGSELVGQAFSSERYFWPRPSATGYNSLPSSGTNAGPTSAALRDSIFSRALRYGGTPATVPADLLMASGSGLDPHISPEAAQYQISRVLNARNLVEVQRSTLEALVRSHTEEPQFGILGQPRVNVMRLNFALDSLDQ